MNRDNTRGAAPADLQQHRKWRRWQIVLAYLILTTLAAASVWLVDREAMRVQNGQADIFAPK